MLQLQLLWHQTSSGMSVLELQCSSVAWELAEKKERNRSVLQQLLISVYFLIKHRIPHTTVYPCLIELLVANGDKILEQHLNQCPRNVQTPPNLLSISRLKPLTHGLRNSCSKAWNPVHISQFCPMNAKTFLHRKSYQSVVGGLFMVAQRNTSWQYCMSKSHWRRNYHQCHHIFHQQQKSGILQISWTGIRWISHFFWWMNRCSEKDQSESYTCSLYPLLMPSTTTCFNSSSSICWGGQEYIWYHDQFVDAISLFSPKSWSFKEYSSYIVSPRAQGE